MGRIKYQGIFVSFEDLSKITPIQLENPILCPHITFSYFPNNMPKEEYEELLFSKDLIGKAVPIWLTHWGVSNDGQNAGFRASFPDELNELYRGSSIVHITTSIGMEGKAVDTANIENWEALSEPIMLVGVIDYFKN